MNVLTKRSQFIKHGRKGIYAALCAVALLVVALGLCSFHGAPKECDAHRASPDVCLTLLMVVAPALLLVQPALSGWLLSAWSPSRYVVPLDLFDRPPKGSFLQAV